MTSKTEAMLEALQNLLDRKRRDKKIKRAHLHEVLKGLKKRQRKLEKKLADDDADKDKRHKWEKEIAVVRAQRVKGIQLCRALNDD